MKKAVIYARYSCDNQTEQSIEGQLRVCNEYAEKHHLEIVNAYIDRAMTGRNDNRPDFKRMLADSNEGIWDCVLVYKFDRFSRNKYESVIYKKQLKDKGISVISAMENIPDTPEGIILESLLEGLNQYYSAELSQKVKRGMRETRLKGNSQGGIRPYGYDVVDHKYVINKKEAKVVRYIFNEYALGVQGAVILKALKKKGVKHKEEKFKRNHIYKILNTEHYSGVYVCHDETFHKVYPPIISRKLFQEASEVRRYNRNGGAAREVYIYRHKLFCKNCGKRYCADSGTSESGKVKRYYKCISKKKYHTCDAKTYPKKILEETLTDFLISFINDSANIDFLGDCLMQKYKKKKNIDFLKLCELEKIDCIKTLNKLLKTSYKEDSIIFDDKIKKLENRISSLNAEIELEKNKEYRRHSLSFIKNFYQESLSLTGIKFVQYLVNRIELGNDEIDIYLEYPYSDRFKDVEIIKSDFILDKKVNILI